MYARLEAAVRDEGGARSIYSQDTTLSRRGLLTRADKRARELEALGVEAGDVVALALGNATDLPVLLFALNKLHAVALPIDPAHGRRTIEQCAMQLRLKAVVRRPSGDEDGSGYPAGYRLRSRRKLSGSLLAADVLAPPGDIPGPPEQAELALWAHGVGGVLRHTFRSGEELIAAGNAVAGALGLTERSRILCAQPLVAPRYFDPAVLGWLCSAAALCIAEGPGLRDSVPSTPGDQRWVVVGSSGQFAALARALRSTQASFPLEPIITDATLPTSFGRTTQPAFGARGRVLLALEELGVLATRALESGATFEPVAGVGLAAGRALAVGGHEIMVETRYAPQTVPTPHAGEPGTAAASGHVHTGYAGRFNRSGALTEVLGRCDALVHLEGQRACLDGIEEVMLEHRRLTWACARLEYSDGGDAFVSLEYVGTGSTAVDDLEEHAIGALPPFMVPRRFTRLQEPPARS